MEESLLVASAVGQRRLVELLVSKGVTVTPEDCQDFESTALHWASRGGQKDVAERLLFECPGLLGVLNTTGTTALHLAAERGNEDHRVAKILRHEVVLDAVDNRGSRPFCYTAGHHLVILERVLEKFPANTLNSHPSFLASCLMSTVSESDVQEGRAEIIEFLGAKSEEVSSKKEALNIGRTALHGACAQSDEEMVKFLLGQGADANSGDEKGRMALHVACGRGDKPIVELLLQHHARVKKTDFWKETPLYKAIARGHVPIVNLLLQKGADANFEGATLSNSSDGFRTPLHVASAQGNLEIIELLLSWGGRVDAVDDRKLTPLCCAIEAASLEMEADALPVKNDPSEGRLDIVRLLVERGAEVSLQTKLKMCSTALRVACSYANQEMVEFLLDEDTDPNLEDEKGRTAFHVACGRGDKAIVELLLSHDARADVVDVRGSTPLCYAAGPGASVEIVDLLLSKGATMPPSGGDRASPLNSAVEKGNVEVVEYLLDKGVDVNLQTNPDEDRTALHVASARGDRQMLEILLSQHASVEAKDQWGQTSLHVAVEKGHPSIVEILLDMEGADVNVKEINYQRENASRSLIALWTRVQHLLSPLLQKGGSFNAAFVKYLLEKGIDVNLQTKPDEGKTALHVACGRGDKAIVELLLSHDARADVVDVRGSTPLCYAAGPGASVEIVDLLLSKGATIPPSGGDRASPLNSAIEKGNVEVVEYLLDKGVDVNLQTNPDGH
uniref:Uncharacterized protein n=1 Tax=Chromera velia CCMP2878 TaxID=1169474 RepID=A0A0G4HBX3_9ALVE|eukprot:Cvel_915.t1-p1 / transcript=Cvel_915.t1 / gene=Cvel_915 / organism=Chromera_velia_CCMP2878 / gene_product=Ankyrin-3, putative / transcript_product=Ankyrin-3, putative / location=Cvel_scaffold29:40158-48223(-) / protein_length=729 / sequence_SO=supercontig / SO=protein_coding / is_pseudo=false